MEKPFIIMLLLWVFSSNLSAQTAVTDKLLLEQLAAAKNEVILDSAIIRTHKVLLEAKKRAFPQSILASLKQLTNLCFEQKNAVQALRYGLELLSRLDEKNTTQYSAIHEHLGDVYFSEGIYGAALNYYKNGLSVGEESMKLTLLKKTGESFFLNHQLDSAAVYFQKEWNVHHENQDYEGQLRSFQQLAKVYELKGDCNTALQFYRNIEKLVKRQDNGKELAIVYNNLGYQYHCLGDNKNAILNFNTALSYCKMGCSLNKITLFTNLGVAYFNYKHFSFAIDYLKRGLVIAQENKEAKEIGLLQNLLAKAFYERGELYDALLYNDNALSTTLKAAEHEVLKDVYLTEANIYERLYEYDKALDYYQKHLRLRDSLLLAERLRQEKLLQHQFSLERSEKEIKLLLVNQKVQDLAFEQLQLEKDKLQLETNNLELESLGKENELALLRREQEIRAERLRVEELQALKAKQELSLTRQRLDAAQKDRQILSLEQKEAQQALEITRREAAETEQKQQILLLNNEKKMQALEIEKQAEFRQFVFWIMAALFIILLLILAGYIFAKKTNRKLEKQKNEIEIQKVEIETEKNKSEQLLLNILPQETAKELIVNGFAKPRYYEKVSVLFADFENFTKLSEKMSPSALIEELNACFVAFDEITGRHGLEKIKTIGDAYMCAGGIPLANECNAQNAVDAAIEMMDFIEMRFQQKLKNKFPYWKMRIGIHTGPVVAGVVGNKKFAYDIWGDTVNTAARMESNSEPGRINVSKTTFEALSKEYTYRFRGKLPMKNKADAEMYFVDK